MMGGKTGKCYCFLAKKGGGVEVFFLGGFFIIIMLERGPATRFICT